MWSFAQAVIVFCVDDKQKVNLKLCGSEVARHTVTLVLTYRTFHDRDVCFLAVTRFTVAGAPCDRIIATRSHWC